MAGFNYNYWVKDHVFLHLGLNLSRSAHNSRYVVEGGNAMVAILVLLSLPNATLVLIF